MDEAPQQNQFYYNPITLPLSHLLPNFNPFTQQFMKRVTTPRQNQHYYDASSQPKPNSSTPSYHYSNKDRTYSTNSVNSDNQLNKGHSYALLRNSVNNEFDENINESKEIEQFNEYHKSHSFRRNHEFDENQEFKQNQYYQQTLALRTKPESSQMQQNQAIPAFHTAFNQLLHPTFHQAYNQAIEVSHKFSQSEELAERLQSDREEFEQNYNINITNEQEEQSNEVFRCDPCAKVFKAASYLTQHKNACHGNHKMYKCKKCGKRYSTVNEVNEHFRKHGDQKPHACSICDKSFNYYSDLRRHMYYHGEMGEMPHSCTICSKGFVRKDHLANHMLSHTRQKVRKVKNETKD